MLKRTAHAGGVGFVNDIKKISNQADKALLDSFEADKYGQIQD